MPRIARLINNGEKTCYHLMSRTALDGYPFRDVDKDKIVNIIKRGKIRDRHLILEIFIVS